mmetsp:Transcript_75234/g.151247  ORF Transcript_75234/g.151247 Transcript_75234/m.151247 type:complete len:378 (+) Transcript_75234:136-1269(+)
MTFNSFSMILMMLTSFPRANSFLSLVKPSRVFRAISLRADNGGQLVALDKLTEVLEVFSSVQNKPGGGRWEVDTETGSFVLVPSLTPWIVIHFIGGAGFGKYPKVAYGALLERLVDSCGGGVAVICTPFDAGLDHTVLAAQSADAFDSVLARRREGDCWPETTRVARLGHSLGAKLHLINACPPLQGVGAAEESNARYMPGSSSSTQQIQIGLIAFNNFPLASSIGQALSFFEAFTANSFVNVPFLRGLADVATMFVQNSGLEFDPSPSALVQRLTPAVAATEITVMRFEDDVLDSSPDLQTFQNVKIVELDGEHLTPVFVQVSNADIAASAAGSGLPPLDGFLDEQGAFSFGDEAALSRLVSALKEWLVPSKKLLN